MDQTTKDTISRYTRDLYLGVGALGICLVIYFYLAEYNPMRDGALIQLGVAFLSFLGSTYLAALADRSIFKYSRPHQYRTSEAFDRYKVAVIRRTTLIVVANICSAMIIMGTG